MKNCNKLFGIIALLVIGFIVVSCSNDTTEEQKVIANGLYDSGTDYRLNITGSRFLVLQKNSSGIWEPWGGTTSTGEISFNTAIDEITFYMRMANTSHTGDFTKISDTQFKVENISNFLDGTWTRL